MTTSPHHHLMRRPPEEGHDEFEVTHGGQIVSIDKGIVALVMTLWDAGIETFFSCEGYDVPEGEDDTAWEWQMYRAYILMSWTDESFDYTQKLLKSFRAFNGKTKTSWEISFDYTEDHGPRICMRFPKSDIGRLLEWFGWTKISLSELVNPKENLPDGNP